jgi:hypothetical protein
MAVEVVVVAFAFDAHQQELAIVGRAVIVVVMLLRFKGVAAYFPANCPGCM